MKKISKTSKKRAVLITAASLIALTTTLSAFTGAFFSKNAELPSEADITKSALMFDLETSYISLLGGERAPQTKLDYNGKPNYVVLDNSLTDDMKNCVKAVFDDINYLFSKINPAYKFIVTENPTFLQSINANTLHIKKGNPNKSYEGVVYCAHLPTLNGLNNSFCTMYISPNKDYTTIKSSGSKLIAHEAGHYLGLGDAYNKTLFNDTAMTFTYFDESFFSTNDILLLASIYSKINDETHANKIVDFACEYTKDYPESYYISKSKQSAPKKPISFWDLAFEEQIIEN